MRHVLAAVLFATLAVPTVAHAQKRSKAKAKAKAKPTPALTKKKPERVKTYDFTGDEIDGDKLSPDGETIMVPDPPVRTSLIKLRTHYVPEVTKSTENL